MIMIIIKMIMLIIIMIIIHVIVMGELESECKIFSNLLVIHVAAFSTRLYIYV